jgi:hypothetical protein
VTRFTERLSTILDALARAGGCCYEALPCCPVEQQILDEPSNGGTSAHRHKRRTKKPSR